jgi:hypothetical protein
MTIDSVRSAAAEVTHLFASLLQPVPDLSAIWPGQAAGNSGGLLMPVLAGVAAAITVTLMLAIYFQTGDRSYRDMIRHGLAAALGLSLLAVVIYDMRNAALAHILKTSTVPTAQFETQWRETTARARALAAEMEQASHPAPEAHQG